MRVGPVIVIELRKLFRRPRTWLTIVLLNALPTVVAILLAITHAGPRPVQGPAFLSAVLQNGSLFAVAALAILLLHFLSLMLGSVLVLMLPLLVWLTPDLRIKKSLLKCNWTIRKRLPRCKMRLKKRLLAFSRRLHARIRKTRYMHKMRCLLINRRSLLLALRLLWKTPIFPSNSRFPRLCAKCLLKLKRLVSILPMTKSKK